MELDITKFWNEAAPRDYAASRAEIGHDAAAITWRHACEDAAEYMLLDSDEKRDAYRDHLRGYGAWSDEEIDGYSETELNALLMQEISGDIREVPGMDTDSWDWIEYHRLAECGVISGRLFPGLDGRVYFYLGI